MKLPKEIVLYIGFKLRRWNDIWSYTMAFPFLRKELSYAKYARNCFDKQKCLHRHGVKWADDRCRHFDPMHIGDPNWDPHEFLEHWIKTPWVDYNCEINEVSVLQWCYLPYGEKYENGVGVPRTKNYWIFEIDFYDDHPTKLPTSRENMIKQFYDNKYIIALGEYNNELRKYLPDFEDWNDPTYEKWMWLVADYSSS